MSRRLDGGCASSAGFGRHVGFIAQELGRPLSGEPLTRVAVSIVTFAELRLGVLAHQMPVVSQDGDYDGVPLIDLVRV